MIRNQPNQRVNFTFVSSTDGNAVVSTGTPAGFVQIDNAAQAALTGTFTNRTNGQWTYNPTQLETDGDAINFQFTLTGAIVKDFLIYTRPVNVNANVALWRGIEPNNLDTGNVLVDLRQWVGEAPLALSSQYVQALSGIVGPGAINSLSFQVNAITAGAIATDAIGADEFAQAAADKVWASTTRDLTDKTGFSLSASQGFNNTGQTDPQPSNVTQWAGNANAPKVSATNELPRMDVLAVTDNLQAATDLAANISNLNATVSSRLETTDARLDNLDATISSRSSHAAADVATAVFAEAIEAGLTMKQAMRVALAALAGKATGLDANAPVFRNAQADTKNRITATTDANGNRSVVTLDLTD